MLHYCIPKTRCWLGYEVEPPAHFLVEFRNAKNQHWNHVRGAIDAYIKETMIEMLERRRASRQVRRVLLGNAFLETLNRAAYDEINHGLAIIAYAPGARIMFRAPSQTIPSAEFSPSMSKCIGMFVPNKKDRRARLNMSVDWVNAGVYSVLKAVEAGLK